MVDGRESDRGGGGLGEDKLAAFERAHARGVTVQQIIDVFAAAGVSITEATFRKYVQLGLLPRSVRVGRKGKSRGSQGLYPATVVRRFDAIRRLMGQGYTIDQIQREFLFVRGELEELSRTLERLYAGLEKAIEERGTDELVRKKLGEAREVGADLLRRLDEIEQRMSMRARMQRAHV
ncbi:MAG: MerR family transcriptional regulator [Sandaracinus sp.]|nr:MerR family transcriptional regulator [Sandaracinaceae bacterium]